MGEGRGGREGDGDDDDGDDDDDDDDAAAAAAAAAASPLPPTCKYTSANMSHIMRDVGLMATHTPIAMEATNMSRL